MARPVRAGLVGLVPRAATRRGPSATIPRATAGVDVAESALSPPAELASRSSKRQAASSRDGLRCRRGQRFELPPSRDLAAEMGRGYGSHTLDAGNRCPAIRHTLIEPPEIVDRGARQDQRRSMAQELHVRPSPAEVAAARDFFKVTVKWPLEG